MTLQGNSQKNSESGYVGECLYSKGRYAEDFTRKMLYLQFTFKWSHKPIKNTQYTRLYTCRYTHTHTNRENMAQCFLKSLKYGCILYYSFNFYIYLKNIMIKSQKKLSIKKLMLCSCPKFYIINQRELRVDVMHLLNILSKNFQTHRQIATMQW